MSEISGLEYIPSVVVGLPKKIAMRRYKMISQITHFCCEHLVHNKRVLNKRVLIEISAHCRFILDKKKYGGERLNCTFTAAE